MASNCRGEKEEDDRFFRGKPSEWEGGGNSKGREGVYLLPIIRRGGGDKRHFPTREKKVLTGRKRA